MIVHNIDIPLCVTTPHVLHAAFWALNSLDKAMWLEGVLFFMWSSSSHLAHWVKAVSVWFAACCQSCRIQRCNAEYVASFSPAAGLQEDVVSDVDYCTALRAYSLCTRRTARGCRGDLVYHSAVFRIKELFAQHNCSSEGPTSSVKVLSTSRPTVVDTCDFESRALALGPADAQKKKYAHCGLFGDPHLRTFKDEFQTCRVEGAWPLIHNRYLSVQVTNVPVVEGSSATATNKVRDQYWRAFIPQVLYIAARGNDIHTSLPCADRSRRLRASMGHNNVTESLSNLPIKVCISSPCWLGSQLGLYYLSNSHQMMS